MKLFTVKGGVLTAGILVTCENPEANFVALLEQFPRKNLRDLLGLREGDGSYRREGLVYPSMLSIERDDLPDSDVLVLVEKDVGNEIIAFNLFQSTVKSKDDLIRAVNLSYSAPVPELLAQSVSFGYGFSTMSMLYRLSEGAKFTVLKRHKKSTIFNQVATVTCVDGGLEVTETPKPRGWFSWLGF